MGWEDFEEMSSEFLQDELIALLSNEREYAALNPTTTATAGNPQDVDQNPATNNDPLNEIRLSICQWNYECVDYFMLDRQVVFMSMNFYDRYVAAQTAAMQQLHDSNSKGRSTSTQASPISSMVCHLIALTSLQLACKLHGQMECPTSGQQRRLRLRMEDFCHMSRGTFCVAMMEEMELSLLTNLQWKLHTPTPLDFLMRYIKILSVLMNNSINEHEDVETQKAANLESGWSVFEVARYQTELATYSTELCRHFSPSKIALASCLNAMNSVVVSTRCTVVSSSVRNRFIQKIYSLGDGFGPDGEDMIQARTILKKLCPKTITLLGKTEDDGLASSASSESVEYELPDVQSFEYDTKDQAIDSTHSPVSVITKTL
jgi:hypothetical protein